MGFSDQFVLRLRAGATEVAILPSDSSPLLHLGPVGKAQRRERWKADAIHIIAKALDDSDVRADLAAKGLHIVIVR